MTSGRISHRRAASGGLLLLLGFADLGWVAIGLAPQVLHDPSVVESAEAPEVSRLEPEAVQPILPAAEPIEAEPAVPEPIAEIQQPVEIQQLAEIQQPAVPQPAVQPVAEIDVGSGSSFELLFRRNNTSLTAESARALQPVLDLFRQQPSLRIQVRGHSCRLGSPRVNRWLSYQRAMAVERFLIRNGVDAERITVEALGGTEPIDPGRDPVAFARNRRVELIWR